MGNSVLFLITEHVISRRLGALWSLSSRSNHVSIFGLCSTGAAMLSVLFYSIYQKRCDQVPGS